MRKPVIVVPSRPRARDIEPATDDGYVNDAHPASFTRELYRVGFLVSAAPAFCLTWLYCVAAYGLAGAAIGWLPALAVAGVSGVAWPGLVVATVAVLAHV